MHAKVFNDPHLPPDPKLDFAPDATDSEATPDPSIEKERVRLSLDGATTNNQTRPGSFVDVVPRLPTVVCEDKIVSIRKPVEVTSKQYGLYVGSS